MKPSTHITTTTTFVQKMVAYTAVVLLFAYPPVTASFNAVNPSASTNANPTAAPNAGAYNTAYPSNSVAPSDTNNCQVLADTNQFRATQGKPALRGDTRLDAEAVKQCLLMAQTGIFEHQVGSSTPSQRVTDAGYNWNAVAENIYKEGGYSDLSCTRAVVSWINSPGKKESENGWK